VVKVKKEIKKTRCSLTTYFLPFIKPLVKCVCGHEFKGKRGVRTYECPMCGRGLQF
jgi:hypothetical protein